MKLELTKTVKIQKWQVVASYKEKVENAAFVGILKYALEQENQGQLINSQTLYEDLLKPLSENACENILFRLREEKYLQKEKEKNNYRLTNLGRESAMTEVFYVSKNGVLEVSYCELGFLEQNIVKIEKIDRPRNLPKDQEKLLKPIPKKLRSTLNSLLKFQNQKDIILEEFKSKVFHSTDNTILRIISNKQQTTIRLLDYEQSLTINYWELRNDLLQKEFPQNCFDGILKIPFNKKSLAFQQAIPIERPQFKNEFFDQCTLKDIPVQPISKIDATQWHLAILSQDLKEYFHDNNAFIKFEKEKRKVFYDEIQPNAVTTNDLIEHLEKNNKTFYKIAKLTTSELLTY